MKRIRNRCLKLGSEGVVWGHRSQRLAQESVSMPAPAMDSWTRREIPSTAMIIHTRAPKRSDQGARLKPTHHTTIAAAPKTQPINPTTPDSNPKNWASGKTLGRTNLSSINSTAATTPGHSRSGFLGVRGLV